MIKSTLAAVAAAPLFAGAAVAGPYVNVETNAGWTGSDYTGATTETHVGFEGELGTDANWYVQAGPAFVTEDGGETTTELSGKVGIGVDVTERLNVYGEVAAITSGEIDFDNDLNYGVKVGAKFSF
jgi:outer membrane autotransporter protein